VFSTAPLELVLDPELELLELLVLEPLLEAELLEELVLDAGVDEPPPPQAVRIDAAKTMIQRSIRIEGTCIVARDRAGDADEYLASIEER
jgi:hypothetical protein